MPATYTYPGVYVEEVPSGVHAITGVSTSDTAFVDRFARGPVGRATRVTSFADFTRQFGGLDGDSEGSYAVQQYYLNGGSVAWVVRVDNGAGTAGVTLAGAGSSGGGTLDVAASSPGVWGNAVEVAVDYAARDPDHEFNLAVREVATVRGRRQVVATEVHRNLSMDTAAARYALAVVAAQSVLVTLAEHPSGVGGRPAATGTDVTSSAALTTTEYGSGATSPFVPLVGGTPGDALDAAALAGAIDALDGVTPFVFNLLCVPAAAALDAPGSYAGYTAVMAKAQRYCEAKRAFLIADVPAVGADSAAAMTTFLANNPGLRSANAAVYWPRLVIPDALNESRPRNVAASGTVAGVYARTDAARGVWKAPAGVEADLRGAAPAVVVGDLENGALNPFGVNVVRAFPVYGNVVWGARTREGADALASEWKYVPVRRLALYLEESLSQGLKWVVFEPNDEPLWAQIRLNVGAFLQGLFRQGAFQGKTPRDAYFVKCDAETTTPADVDRGVVNILVGFAPLRPAEFVVLRLQQIAQAAAA